MQYRLGVIHPMGNYEAFVEAESPEAAEAAFFDNMTEAERARRYTVESITEHEPKLGWVLVMGGDGMYGKYGAGPTLEQAKAEFRKVGGRLGLGYSVFRFDPETDYLGVNQMGAYSFRGSPPAEEKVPAR